MTTASIPWARKFSTWPTCLAVSLAASTMVSSTSGWALAHLVMASRTLVNHTSSKRAIATPILILAAAWAGIVPRANAIMAIAGTKNFASFIFLISFIFWGIHLQRRGSSRMFEQQGYGKSYFLRSLFNSFWGQWQHPFPRLR